MRLADTGSWAVPGGAIDPNELPAEAAVRECWEETGVLVEPIRITGVFGGPEFLIKYPNGDVTYYTLLFSKLAGFQAGAKRMAQKR